MKSLIPTCYIIRRVLFKRGKEDDLLSRQATK